MNPEDMRTVQTERETVDREREGGMEKRKGGGRQAMEEMTSRFGKERERENDK